MTHSSGLKSAVSKKEKEVVEVTRTKIASKDYGLMSKMVFPNGSAIIVSKKGWNIRLHKRGKHKGESVIITYPEIGVALGETVLLGYAKTKKEKAIPPSTKVLGILANKL